MQFRHPRFVLVALTALTLAACSTDNIPRNTLRVRAVQLNLESLRGSITVQSTDGAFAEAQYFSIVGDSAMWIEPKTANVRGMPLPALQSFVIHDHFRSMMIGGMAGISVGGIFAAAMDGKPDEARLGVLLSGELLGFLVGSFFACDRTYIIDNPATIPLPDTTRKE